MATGTCQLRENSFFRGGWVGRQVYMIISGNLSRTSEILEKSALKINKAFSLCGRKRGQEEK